MSIKNIALFLFLALPMGAHAEDLSIADANQAVIDSCKSSGGKMTEFKAGKCDFQRCIYSDNKSDGQFYRAGDNQRSNCSDSELKKELQRIRRDLGDMGSLDDDGNGGSGRGSRNGRDGDDDGDGRGGRGGRGGRDGDGAGNGDGGDSAIVCDFGTVNLKLPPGDKCYKKCTKKVNGVRVPDTGSSSCRKCIQKYHRNADGSPIVFTTDVRGTVTLPDVQVRTGEIVCRDINTGREVKVVGTKCEPGQVIVTSGGNSSGGGNGRLIVVNGGTSTTSTSSGSGQLPAFCLSDKKSDKKKCAEYLARQDRFRCASSSDTSGCIRDIDVVRSRYSSDCVDCDTKRRGGGSSFAEILGAIAPIGVAGLQGYFGYKSNKAWAGAAATGFEQCQINNNNYLQYVSANELPGVTPEQQRMMGCNGFGLGQYAGMGGMYGNYYGAGYSPGFVGGMMGPYGMYNPYGGMGGMVGGAVGGYVGGMQGGMYGGYMGGYQSGMTGGLIGGGLIGGGSIGGLVQGGYAVAGMNGGYMGGMAAGYPAGGYMTGGYMTGGYMGGMAAGYPAGGYMTGGMAAGYPAGGGIGGLVQGGYAIAGMNGGYTGGYVAGGMAAGYPAGGMYAAGGMYPAGGYSGGLVQGGYAISGVNGGMMGYPGTGMGGYGTGGLGGWGSGVGGTGYNPYGYGNGYGYGSAYGMQASMQASSRDAMLQQQGISYQMGMIGSGSMGYTGMTQAYGGYAGYSPMNMGYGMGYGSYGYMGM